jgi:hypothetical protein
MQAIVTGDAGPQMAQTTNLWIDWIDATAFGDPKKTYLPTRRHARLILLGPVAPDDMVTLDYDNQIVFPRIVATTVTSGAFGVITSEIEVEW